MTRLSAPSPAANHSAIARINLVLPFFCSGELSGLADYLERELASRIARPARKRGSARGPRRRIPLPIRAGD